MSNLTATQTASALSVTVTTLLALSRNPAFPAPVSGSGLSTQWDSTAISTFATQWAAIKAHGWKLPTAILATMNVAAMAAAAPGARYTALPGSDPLFDL